MPQTTVEIFPSYRCPMQVLTKTIVKFAPYAFAFALGKSCQLGF
jgi:hypothetical protein